MRDAVAFPHPDVNWPLARPFWEGASMGELRLPRCRACQRLCWYPEAACPRCAGRLVWEAVSGQASLYSWVVVSHPFLPAFGAHVPFVPAIVALDEDPTIRIVTRIIDADPNDLEFDLPLSVTFAELVFDNVAGSTPAPFFRVRPAVSDG